VHHVESAHRPQHHGGPRGDQEHALGLLTGSQAVLANLLEEGQRLVGGREVIVPTQQAICVFARYGLQGNDQVAHTIRLLRFA